MKTLDFAMVLPGLQILRGKKAHLTIIQVQSHGPLIRRFVPDYLGIAITFFDMLDNRIFLVLFPGSTAIVTIRNRLSKRLPFRERITAAGGGVDAYNHFFLAGLKARGIFFVHHRRAGKDGSQFIGMNRIIQFRPVDYVVTDSVAPGHIPPGPAKGIVLIK